MRSASSRPTKNGGWFHRLGDEHVPHSPVPRLRISKADPAPPSLANDLNRYVTQADPRQLADFADGLGVSVKALRTLGIGRASAEELRSKHFAKFGSWWQFDGWTFPARRQNGSTCGLRVRADAGKKVGRYAAGLIRPVSTTAVGPLLIVEGETDAAAAIDLGFDVVGLPGVRTCWPMLIDLLKTGPPRDVVIIFDADDPGRRAAADLAKQLSKQNRVRIVTPPDHVKDLRGWLRAGVTRNEILAAIERSQPAKYAPCVTLARSSNRNPIALKVAKS